MDFHSIITYKK